MEAKKAQETNETAIGLLRLAFEHMPIHSPEWARIDEFLKKSGSDLKRKDDACDGLVKALRGMLEATDHWHNSGGESSPRSIARAALVAAGVQS